MNVPLNAEEHQQLKEIASKHRRSMAATIRWLIEEEHERLWPKPLRGRLG